MKAWFLSDLHLKNMQERNSQILLRFLRSLSELSTETSETQIFPSANFADVLKQKKLEHEQPELYLFLLGDIFDIWVSDHSVFVKEFLPIVEEIQLLCQKNFRVIYFEGNHDMHIDRFWTKQLGVEVHEEIAFFNLNGLALRAEHGDLINVNDTKHLRSRRILRHPAIEFLGHQLPGFFWKWLATRYSQRSRVRSANYRQQNQEEIRSMIRDHARRVYHEQPFDLVVSGHMHVFDDYTFKINHKSVRSINLGSWMEEPRVLFVEQNKTSLEIQIIPIPLTK